MDATLNSEAKHYMALFLKGTQESAGIDREYFESKFGTVFCPVCHQALPEIEAVDLVLAEDILRKRTWLNFTFNGGVGLIREEMVDMLGRDLVEQHLYLGTVWTLQGTVVDNWRTFRGHFRLKPRGKGGRARICENCGRVLYYSPAAKEVLYPPPPDLPMFDGTVGRLVLRKDIFERLDLKRIRNVWIRELETTDVSPDGDPPYEVN